jgi:hypothetical protein
MIWFMSHSFVLITKQPESQTVPECCALRVSALATTSLARFCPMRKAPSIKIYVGLAKQFLTNLEQAWVGAVGSLYLVENWMTASNARTSGQAVCSTQCRLSSPTYAVASPLVFALAIHVVGR